MSVFTTVTAEQLAGWLRNYAIGTLVSLEGIPAGIENTNYFVTTTAGRYVLTLFEKLQNHELPFYLKLMAHLSERGVPCPRPVANRKDELFGALNGKPAALVSFLPGKDLARPRPGHCAQVGGLLADMHLAGKTYRLRMDNPRGPKWWRGAAAHTTALTTGSTTASTNPGTFPAHPAWARTVRSSRGGSDSSGIRKSRARRAARPSDTRLE